MLFMPYGQKEAFGKLYVSIEIEVLRTKATIFGKASHHFETRRKNHNTHMATPRLPLHVSNCIFELTDVAVAE